MSDREARSEESTLVACDQCHYGSTQRGGVYSNAALAIIEDRDNCREDYRDGTADRDVRFFSPMIQIQNENIVLKLHRGYDVIWFSVISFCCNN